MGTARQRDEACAYVDMGKCWGVGELGGVSVTCKAGPAGFFITNWYNKPLKSMENESQFHSPGLLYTKASRSVPTRLFQ